ncbi:MAG: type II secretion system GspH family protein [Phycisphaerae bacterium]|nr:type II secretion system GspH family protein [Phycisphaerae bacterium]
MCRQRGFTLIELLVVIAVISAIMAITLPVLRYVREQALETVCQSNLRQMGIILKTYTQDHNARFPEPNTIYHAPRSFTLKPEPYWQYLECCRWHDPRIGLNSSLIREHPELRGSLVPYISNPEVLLCKTGKRANTQQGCINPCSLEYCFHDPNVPFEAQYTYSMNAFFSTEIRTGKRNTLTDKTISRRTMRITPVHTVTQVTRSPSQVFAFGEENSWRVILGQSDPNELRTPISSRRPTGSKRGRSSNTGAPIARHGSVSGTLRLPALAIKTTFQIDEAGKTTDATGGFDNFATYHRPPKGNLDAGHSYLVMLDGHTQKVTVSDQLRKSRLGPGDEPSQYGPGGNLALAWPIDIEPPDGWEDQ